MKALQPNLPLVLASNSPRRQQFLQDLGLPFSVLLPSGFKEVLDSELSPEENAKALARGKAYATIKEHNCSNSLVIASDTIVVLNNNLPDAEIFGKPENVQEAFSTLKRMVGRKHTVISAVAMILPDKTEIVFADSSDVYFHNWSDSVLMSYAETGEGLDKAGAYAIQGIGTFLVDRVEGAYSTIVGFPVHKFIQKLLDYKIVNP